MSLPFTVTRLSTEGPLIHAGMEDRMTADGGSDYININGPSALALPDWLPAEARVGGASTKYYLFFAHHKGSFIRLAYASHMRGPWAVHPPGVLDLRDSLFPTERPPPPPASAPKTEAELAGSDALRPHIASPDVVIDEQNRQFVMYFHGLEGPNEYTSDARSQVSRVATSWDAVSWSARQPILPHTYARSFRCPQVFGEEWFLLAMPGIFYRSRHAAMQPFSMRERDNSRSGLHLDHGKCLFPSTMRHSACLVRGDTLYVFWTDVGDAPERIYVSTIRLSADWDSWCLEGERVEVLRPAAEWEGAGLPPEPSVRGEITRMANQLRDPCIFTDPADGRVYLLYCGGGEHNINLAEVCFEPSTRSML
mmetsp:Transcript_105369/g.328446  ORF Transcript_105369/g.328446 Transcript_105369/m.328446 type:complete len:366 (+) Transcript_105369:82-1179(+)